MKNLLSVLLILISCLYYGQLDREHWFAPMFDGQGNTQASGYKQFLHLSTNETTPFSVTVYNNNSVIATRTISKGNPAVIQITRGYIITRSISDLFKVRSLGLYVKADKPCFANLRFGVTNHAEIITSKGTAGIGTKFYTVVAPNSYISTTSSTGITNLGFSASFLATEDNTTVTVNNFKKALSFNTIGASPSFTFTLNKGQSYIIDGRSESNENLDGFIGATVTSDKPISMSNGNFNGQYATTDENLGSDILMDQSVPVDKLGDEFVIVKGYGAIGNNMEGAIVVATEKNTSVYLNDNTTPEVVLANEGDYYFIKESNYIPRGGDHYNLHIKSDKNVYVYQLLGGVESGSTPLATGGMNYIPPLNCYLPKKIDEISFISRIAQTDGDYTFVTKLNIITEKGAKVWVNGVEPSAFFGPYDISSNTANQKWVTYSIPNVIGNITVESTKAVTAGIASGNGAFGYGGYFAGFSSIPLILKVAGECLPGVKLAVTEGFDKYTWQIFDKASGTYIAAPGINNTFSYEPTEAGIYNVKVQQGSCPEIQTADFKFYNCTTYTNIDKNICKTETIVPGFSLSSQNVDAATIKEIEPPKKGTISINTTDPTNTATYGKIIYTALPTASGTDTFKVQFCGVGAIPDCETVQYTIFMIEKNSNVVLQECSTSGIAEYNLTKANVTSDNSLIKNYFNTYNGAENNIISDKILNFTQYSTADKSVFVRLENNIGCVAVVEIQLKSKLAPEVKENLYTKIHCDEDIDEKIDGIYKVDLNTINPIVLVKTSDFIVRYYKDETKAIAGGNDNLTGIFSFTGDDSVWIRVDAPNGCPSVMKKITLKTGTKITVNPPVSTFECDSDQNNSETVNLDKYVNLFGVAAYDSVLYFDSLLNAQNNKPKISASQDISGPKTFYYRFKKDGLCDEIGTLNLSLRKSTSSSILQPSVTICEGGNTKLKVESTFKQVKWNNGSEDYEITVGAGNYYVDLTNSDLCVYRQYVKVLESPKPIWTISNYNSTICDDNFDGIFEVNLDLVTPKILSNSTLFTLRYYLDENDANFGNNNYIQNLATWSFTSNKPIWVRAISQYCPAEVKRIDFKIGTNLQLDSSMVNKDVCDNDLNDVQNVNLDSYKDVFTKDKTVSVKYFDDLTKAKNNKSGDNISASQDISANKTFYVRFSKNGFCDVIGTLNLIFKKPKKSEKLKDKEICPGTTTTLDAGEGFSKYVWSNGDQSQTTDLGVGNHYVDLYFNNCVYRQYVSLTAVSLPEITNIEIQGTTVTVNVSGGNPPYQYALDKGNYQTSNIFYNVRGGDHLISVISADKCAPVVAEINVIQPYNVITPNGDGVNDVLNYSGLVKKDEPFIEIFDRYGKLVFKGDRNNLFSWDGKSAGKPVSTGSYWYIMKWKEPGSVTISQYNGWILVKNRD